MKNFTSFQGNKFILLPFWGTVVFAILYVIATWFYPGGSQMDEQAKGFSWLHNYWCNLLSEPALNGQHNPSKPIAILAMAVLAVTLSSFWFLFAASLNFKVIPRRVIQVSGLLSMTTGLFIYSAEHDLLVNVASFFGLIATLGTFFGLWNLKWYGLFGFGIFNILLVALNNLLYYNDSLIFYLPVVQKLTFLSFLLWVSLICLKIYRKMPS